MIPGSGTLESKDNNLTLQFRINKYIILAEGYIKAAKMAEYSLFLVSSILKSKLHSLRDTVVW
jgi:hypothetical protein